MADTNNFKDTVGALFKVLVIKDGTTRLVNIKNQDTMTKLLDMVPGILDKFTTRKEDTVTEEDVAEMLDDAE